MLQTSRRNTKGYKKLDKKIESKQWREKCDPNH